MSWAWRALVALLLIGGPAIWLPTHELDAAPQFEGAELVARGPAWGKKDDPDDLCGSSNPRKQKKCHFNGWDNWNDNAHDNDNEVVATDPATSGATITQDGLTVELWRSTENPVVNAPMALAVKGDGAAIERVWWWAEGPVYTGPYGDDLAFVGTMSYDCGGSQPCAWSWPAVTRYSGWYMLHARIRDTAGREVQTDWKFLSSAP
jgi:hypothetical protein